VHELSRFDRRDGTGGWPRLRNLRNLDLGDQSGAMLVEVLVSAIMVVIVAVGVFGAFDAATRASSEERHRARAHSIAQADLSRMRTMRISDLSNLNDTRTVTQDGTTYTIVSRGEFQTDATGTASCEAGTASADYIKISSTVTWPSVGSRPPVITSSIVAPPNGSVSPDSGSLAVGIEDSQNVGIPNVGLSGTGAGSFSGQTGPNGCAIFGNLPAGNYTLTVQDSTLVDPDGDPPQPQATSVVAEGTNTIVLQYDDPGSIPVTFTTTSYAGTPMTSSADSVVAFNTGMTAAKSFGTPGSPASQITASSLFPFASPYAVYAGTCEGDNPNPAGEDPPPVPDAIASVVIPPGGSQAATIELPALHLTVWSGTEAAPGTPVQDARVRIQDDNCPEDPPGSGTAFRRTFNTNVDGRLPDPGLPYSVYDVCADDGTRQSTLTDVAVQDPDAGTARDIFLQGSASSPGTCP
jgi:Tfp pilus assembly protein PilV